MRASPLPPFTESVQEEVSVSGSVIVGVTRTSTQNGAQLLSGVQVPFVTDTFCVTARSRDGIYFAKNTFNANRQAGVPTPAWIEFSFAASRQKDRLLKMRAGDLAVSAQSGSCENASNEYLLMRQDQMMDSDGIEVFVNSFDATDVFVVDPDGAEHACTEVLEDRRSVFDYRCHVPASVDGRSSLLLEVHRERYGRSLPTVGVRLLTSTTSNSR